jgi:hypothetical protein
LFERTSAPILIVIPGLPTAGRLKAAMTDMFLNFVFYQIPENRNENFER